MADGGRHLAQGGQLGRLLDRLLGHAQLALHPLAFRDLAGQARVQGAQVGRFPAIAGGLDAGAARQDIEAQRHQQGKAHDFQRKKGVHPVAHGFEGGEQGHPPAPEGNARFRLHDRAAAHIGIGGAAGPVGRDLEGALDRRRGGTHRQRVGQGVAAPARFGGQDDLSRTVGDDHRVRDPRPRPFQPGQVGAHDDHAQRAPVADHRAGIGEVEAPRAAGRDGEDRVVRPQRLDIEGRQHVVRAQELAVRGPDRPARVVQKPDRGRADVLLRRDQPGRDGGVVLGAERPDQRGVARQQQRHDRGALQFRQQVPGIKRRAQFGPHARVFRKAFGQPDVGPPDRADGGGQQQDDAQPVDQPGTGGQPGTQRGWMGRVVLDLLAAICHAGQSRKRRPSAQAPASNRPVYAATVESISPWNSRAPSDPPCAASAARSGCGIIPSTRRFSDSTPAMSATEPFRPPR